jgi:hypothetical protein
MRSPLESIRAHLYVAATAIDEFNAQSLDRQGEIIGEVVQCFIDTINDACKGESGDENS